jgi:hypothetical protein
MWRMLKYYRMGNFLICTPRLIVRSRMKWLGYITHILQMRIATESYSEDIKGRRRLGEPWRRRIVDTETFLKETGCVGVDWIQLAQDKLNG